MTKCFKVLDLFCGAGGMTEGFRRAGFDVPFASDFSADAAKTYNNRQQQLGYHHRFFQGDINQLCVPNNLMAFLGGSSIDVVVGGPPCQGFSYSGKRCDDDQRNKLFLSYLDVIRMVKPQYFVMENVSGILSMRLSIKGLSGRVYHKATVPEIIVQEAKFMGYKVSYKMLNAQDFGTPQNRPRIFFFGCLWGNPMPNFPKEGPEKISVKDALSDLILLSNDNQMETYKISPQSLYQKMIRNGLTPNVNKKTIAAIKLKNHQASVHSELVSKRFSLLREGENIRELLQRLPEELAEVYATKKRNCRKLISDKPSRTITTLPDDFVHYKQARSLTVREVARLQGFDDSFEFLGPRTTGGDRRKHIVAQYTQVGNAVPPFLSYAIAKELKNSLQQLSGEFEDWGRRDGKRIIV